MYLVEEQVAVVYLVAEDPVVAREEDRGCEFDNHENNMCAHGSHPCAASAICSVMKPLWNI